MADEDVGLAAPQRRTQDVRTALGENIRRMRGLRDLTVREMSAELKTLGLSLSPSGVSEIENAARKVAVDELLVIAIALNTSPVDLLMPSDRVWLQVADNVDPLHTSELLYWLEGARPWSQFVSREDFTDAALEPHRTQLRWAEFPVLKRIDALASSVRLALTSLPVTEPLAPILQHALDRVVKEVENIIASVEADDASSDGR